MSDTTREMCEQHAKGLRSSLEVIWTAIDLGVMVNESGELYEGDADDTPDEYETDPSEYLTDWPLEIVWERGTPFAVVFGTGGPHVEIEHDTRQGSPRIAVYWGGESAYAYGEVVERTADYFREIATEMSYGPE